MFSSSKYLRKNFFPSVRRVYFCPAPLPNWFEITQSNSLRDVDQAQSPRAENCDAWSLTGEQMSFSALEQSHPSDGWTRWLRLVAASTTQLLSLPPFSGDRTSCELPQRVWQEATGGVMGTQSSVCTPRPCSSLVWSFLQLPSTARKVAGFENILIFAHW